MGCSSSTRDDVKDFVHVDPALAVTTPLEEEKKSASPVKESSSPAPPAPVKVEFPELVVYCGSQTGTSTRLANELIKEARDRHGLKAEIVDMSSFDEHELPGKRLVFFVVSTYGEGGPTDSSQRFYQWLINEHFINKEKGKFAGMKFAVLGCGDSSFKKTFNRMAKLTSEKLQLRGAVQYRSPG